jgi:hypothetical protein
MPITQQRARSLCAVMLARAASKLLHSVAKPSVFHLHCYGDSTSVNFENAGKKSKAILPFSLPRFLTMCKMSA